MKRRDFLKGAVAAGVATAFPLPAMADKPMTATEVQSLTAEFVRQFQFNVEQIYTLRLHPQAIRDLGL